MLQPMEQPMEQPMTQMMARLTSLAQPLFQELDAVQIIGSPFMLIFSSFFQWF
jgi:hypothetical protein